MSDLWTYLAQGNKPIVMYGMGNGADKILGVCESFNITVSDFFASDGFVRGQSFHGKMVLSFSEIKEKYKDFIILLAFGSNRPEVLSAIYDMYEKYEMYAPDVPLFGDNLFNRAFCEKNAEKIAKAQSLLADDLSKLIFENTILYKLSGKISYLRNSFSKRDEVFSSLLAPKEYKTYVDLGAYDGDTIKELISYGCAPQKIVALEPDRKNFKKLCTLFRDSLSDMSGVELYRFAAWSEECELYFNCEGNRNSGVSQKGETVRALALDKIPSAYSADYIKYDVEGSELQALAGSANIIKERQPDLYISLYHRSEDIFELVHYVKNLNEKYKLYIRHFEYVPAWDLCLIATVR